MLADVAVQTQKQAIIQWLSNVDDEKVISQFFALKNNLADGQELVKLTPLENKLAQQGIEEMQAGLLVPHEDVRKIYAKWL